MSHPENHQSNLDSIKDSRSPGMRGLNDLFNEAYSFGKLTVGDFQKHGPDMLNQVVEEVRKDPRKGIQAAAVLALTATAVVAETPEIIAIASAGAILGGLHLAGEACANQAKDWERQIKFKQ